MAQSLQNLAPTAGVTLANIDGAGLNIMNIVVSTILGNLYHRHVTVTSGSDDLSMQGAPELKGSWKIGSTRYRFEGNFDGSGTFTGYNTNLPTLVGHLTIHKDLDNTKVGTLYFPLYELEDTSKLNSATMVATWVATD